MLKHRFQSTGPTYEIIILARVGGQLFAQMPFGAGNFIRQAPIGHFTFFQDPNKVNNNDGKAENNGEMVS